MTKRPRRIHVPDPPQDRDGDRLIVEMDPGGPAELLGLTDSFAALARLYERHHRQDGEAAPKLYITKLETGSIFAEIAPYALLLGQIVVAMDTSLIVGDFTRRLSNGIKAFSDPQHRKPESLPSKDDAEDIKAFVRPLTGKAGAKLGIRHARFEKKDGERHTVAEYTFDETELNRAAINIDRALADQTPTQEVEPELLEPAAEPETVGGITKEVMLFFEQASRRPGKQSGRTGDRGIVPDISPKSLPVYFRKSFQDLKDRMVRSEVNPLSKYAFVVDVHVQRVGGKPKAYIVVNVHDVIDLGDDK